MKRWWASRQFLQTLTAYGSVVILSVIVLIWGMKLWKADLRIPFVYAGDVLPYHLWVKGIIENGWYLHNPKVGAPSGLDMQDFPMADNLHFAVMKVLGWFWPDAAAVVNVYYLLLFPLTALSTFYVFRRFSLSFGPSLVGALLFSFLPYRLLRGEYQLFLSAYYLIPLIVMVIIRLFQGWIPLSAPSSQSDGKTGRLSRSELIGSMVICGLTASAGVYYAAFACFFLLVAGIWSSSHRKSWYPLGVGLLFITVITVGTLANLAPSIIFVIKNGPNPEAVARQPIHAQIYAVDVAHMLLPTRDHRIAAFRALAESRSNDWGISLGIVGGLGFLILTGRFLFSRGLGSPPKLMDHLSRLNVWALLLGAMGGFGFLLALSVTPWIRCYHRISIYIAFFAIFGVVLILDKLDRRLANTNGGNMAFAGLLLSILVIGLLDQTDKASVPQYAHLRREYDSDRELVTQIERLMPGAAIFQMPYAVFPEGDTECYDPLRGCLHSRSLSWSSGGMRGRLGDAWLRQVSSYPPKELVQSLALAGFGGIWLDRSMYGDKARAMEAKLAELLAVSPLVSANARFLFFDMGLYQRRLRTSMSALEWDARHESVMNPVLAMWRGGFHRLDVAAGETSRWCSAKGQLWLLNESGKGRQVELEMVIIAADPGTCHLKIEGELYSDQLELRGQHPKMFQTVLTVPPGHHKLTFSCDGKKIDVPVGNRNLVFRIDGFRITTKDFPENIGGLASIR